MMAIRQNLVALAAAALLAGGCAHGTANMQYAGTVGDRTPISVTNHNWSDMTIYLVRAGSQQRLGTVTSQGTETFMVPTHMMSSSSRVYLMADPIGSSQAFVSVPIQIGPGQKAMWQLENSISLSSVWVR